MWQEFTARNTETGELEERIYPTDVPMTAEELQFRQCAWTDPGERRVWVVHSVKPTLTNACDLRYHSLIHSSGR